MVYLQSGAQCFSNKENHYSGLLTGRQLWRLKVKIQTCDSACPLGGAPPLYVLTGPPLCPLLYNTNEDM